MENEHRNYEFTGRTSHIIDSKILNLKKQNKKTGYLNLSENAIDMSLSKLNDKENS